MASKPLEILVYGTGAVGATFAWRAAQNPHVRVTTVCRSNYLAVKTHGFFMRSRMWGDGIFKPHRVIERVRDVQDISFDYVVCANKVVEAPGKCFIEDIRPAIREHTAILSAQNGFCVEPPLHNAFPGNTILSAVCYVSCVQNTPGHVQQVAAIRPKAFHIGAYQGEDADARLDELIGLSSKFGRTDNITAERWTKLIFNGSWNPVAAIFGLTTQEIYCNDKALTLVQTLADEIYAVACASGINLPIITPFETTNCARDQPPITLSMLQDVRFSRPIEVDALCGSILRQAMALGVPTPVLGSTYNSLMRINHCLGSISCLEEASIDNETAADFGFEQRAGQNWTLAGGI